MKLFAPARRLAVGWTLLVALVARPAPARAERLAAPKLLPRNTVVYVRVPSVPQLREKFMDTALWKMAQDPQLKPLVEQLYGSLASAWLELKNQVDLPLDQLLDIPQGEITLAVIVPNEGPPQLLALLDVGDHLPAARKLLDRGALALDDAHATKAEETVGDVKVITYQLADRRNNQVSYCVLDSTIVLANSSAAVKQVIARFGGEKPAKDDPAGVLAENPAFVEMMQSIRATRDKEVELVVFIDPIALARGLAQGNAAATFGLAILPVLGLDGLKGLGGSMAFSQGEMDMVTHIHLLLAQPRAGVLEMLALEPGDTTPERWVPADVASYTTGHWDAQTTYSKGVALFDSLPGQAEGAAAKNLKTRISDPLGADLETELLPALEGRITYITWIERPITLQSQHSLVAIKLKDKATFEKTYDKLLDKYKDNLEKVAYGGAEYYLMKFNQPPRERPTGAVPRPCLAIVDDCLMLADQPSLLEKIIASPRDASRSLAAELDFKLIASKIARQAGSNKPGFLSFNRPEEGMRMLYELGASDKSRESWQKQAERNPVFKSLNKALDDHPLPPFEVIAKYLAPSGAMITNDETGLHYTAFTLRRN